MRNLSSYKRIGKLCRRFQLEVTGFILLVLGAWLVWKLSGRPYVSDAVIYGVFIWILMLVIHLIRIIYLVKRSKRD